MEISDVECFLSGFDDDIYPKEFTDRYEAMECLSSGQYSETLLVREKTGGKLCVAKCYRKGHHLFELTEPEELHSLFHRGLPAFVGELRSETMRCIIREYIEGKTLCEYKQDYRFTQEMVRSIGIELCGILKYLHSRTPPVIHRDIKPQNVVILDDGSPVLIDLGISRLYVEGARSDTVFCGTHDFAPPEQYGFLQTDCRSDIYSLGILLAWMLTGNAAPVRTPQTPLEAVIAKCTAFDPDRRFRDAAAVIRALQETEPAVRKRKRIVLGAAVVLTIAFLLFFSLQWMMGGASGIEPEQDTNPDANRDFIMVALSAGQPSKSGFTQPLIENAVRMMLGKDADDPLSSEELSSVTELYITHNAALGDVNTFFKAHQELYEKDPEVRGPITSLQDLKLLPNLHVLCMAAQQIQDISPLRSLSGLYQVELRFNLITDITPLSGLKNLAKVGLNSNPVTDITPLLDCPALDFLDLCDAGEYKGNTIAKLGDLEFLDISNSTDSYLYLGGKSIAELKLSNTAMADLSCLRNVKRIQKLEIRNTLITDLSEIERHTEITYLRLSDTSLTDFSVLLKLPKLETVSVSESAKVYIEPVARQGAFNVIYE